MSVFARLFQRARDDRPRRTKTPVAPEPADLAPPPAPPPVPAEPIAAPEPASQAAPAVAVPPALPRRAAAPVVARHSSPEASAPAPVKAAPVDPPVWSDAQASDAEIAATIDKAVDDLLIPSAVSTSDASNGVAHGASTAQDLEALHATYAALAVEYCAPVRNVMIEVRWGEVSVLWLELVRSSLAALRAMAEKVELGDLLVALDRFNAAVGATIRSGQTTIGAERRTALLDAYAGLTACLPAAFDLDGERARREPIILQSLLLLVPGVVPLTVERFLAAGLNRLDVLVKAHAEEIAAVTGIEISLAAGVLEVLRAERNVGAGNPDEERRRLQALTGRLAGEHAAFERAAADWTAEAKAAKGRQRQLREQTLLRIKVSLARLGEVDRIERLERLPFGKKIEDLYNLLRTAPPGGSAGARGAKKSTGTGAEPHSQRGI
jgi:hypothetical protein